MVNNLINERIAKKIASSGICSRREAERLINNGNVKNRGYNPPVGKTSVKVY